ncbi:hypothetical protein ACFFHH_04275 [Cytobacillus solani]|uniref:hypothetical protein n=1 Tax=Cytobacillus solani TaxID=1637975 RepID=UPI0006AB77CD|nr:hypothetical protein [Cytobacillus solani]USK55746.1 hypothetical protein LIS82_04235 [Cytobacillus solani]
MDHSKIDNHIKNTISKMELEVPHSVKQRINETLHNLPKKRQSLFFSSSLKYILSSVASILIAFGAISYLLSIETINPSNQATDGNNTVIHDYVYSGESEHWKAKFKFSGKGVFFERGNGKIGYESESEEVFQMEYKGELIEIQGKTLSYNYKTTAGGGSGNIDEMSQKIVGNSSGAGNGAMMREDEKVEVTVEWDGKKETFFLQTEKRN